MLEIANMLLLSKEASEKDRSLKTQLILLTNSQHSEIISGELPWKKMAISQMKELISTLKRKIFQRVHYAM